MKPLEAIVIGISALLLAAAAATLTWFGMGTLVPSEHRQEDM